MRRSSRPVCRGPEGLFWLVVFETPLLHPLRICITCEGLYHIKVRVPEVLLYKDRLFSRLWVFFINHKIRLSRYLNSILNPATLQPWPNTAPRSPSTSQRSPPQPPSRKLTLSITGRPAPYSISTALSALCSALLTPTVRMPSLPSPSPPLTCALTPCRQHRLAGNCNLFDPDREQHVRISFVCNNKLNNSVTLGHSLNTFVTIIHPPREVIKTMVPVKGMFCRVRFPL